VAVSVDPVEVTRKHAAKQGYTFTTLLSDANTEVIRRYDLLHSGGGTDGADISRSAEFVLDAGGTVRWANITQGEKARPTGAKVLKVLEQLDAESATPKR
jgi:peroxiredoxin